MTNDQLRAALGALSPAQQRIVAEAALVIRAARDAGDTRPAAQIAAHLVQPGCKTVLH